MTAGLDRYTEYKVKNVQLIKGHYGFRVILFYEDGSSKTQQHAGFSTKQDAEDFRDVVKVELRQRTYLVYGNVLFKDYAAHWLDDIWKKHVNCYNSYYSYSNIMKNHITPFLGNKMMAAINSADVHRLYRNLFEYSESITKQARIVLNACLRYAIEEKAVNVNAASGVNLPKGVKKTQYHKRTINIEKTLTHEQIMKLIEGSKDSPIHIMILFNVVMGLRCSEIIGLKYSDVDFIHQKLHVCRQLGRNIRVSDEDLAPKTYTKQEKELKTRSSERTIDVPDIVYDAIIKERKRYDTLKRRRKTAFQDLGYICCSSYGRPRSKGYHFKEFKRLLKELDLPDIRWHDLRGTCATQLLLHGINPKAVAKNLGHAKEIVTVDNYADNARLSVIKLERLDSFIISVVPKEETVAYAVRDLSDMQLNIAEYLPK